MRLSFLGILELMLFLGFVDVVHVIAVLSVLLVSRDLRRMTPGNQVHSLVSDSLMASPDGELWKEMAEGTGRRASREPKDARREVKRDIMLGI